MISDAVMTKNQKILLKATAEAKAVAIAGLDKNAGKTTVLNALVHAYRHKQRRLVMTSIGYDGEACDLLHGHLKPQIYVFPGMLVITAAEFLSTSSIDAEIINVFSPVTVFGSPVLAVAKQAGFVTLAGPTSLHELISMQESVLAESPNALFIIDGAFGRRMNASEAYADVVIFCLSASSTGPSELIEVFTHRQRLMTLPFASKRMKTVATLPLQTENGMVFAKGELDGKACLYLRGALTDRIALHWLTNSLKEGDAMIVDDRANAFLSSAVLKRMEKTGVHLFALKGADLKLVALNPANVRNVDGFRAALESVSKAPVIVLNSTPSIGKAI